MENLFIFGGYILAVVFLIITIIFYSISKDFEKKLDNQGSALLQHRDYINDIKCSLYGINRTLVGKYPDHQIVSYIKYLNAKNLEVGEANKGLYSSLEKSEESLGLAREGSRIKNGIISTQKKRILELEIVCLMTENNKKEKFLGTNLTMLRKMTIKELQNEKDSFTGSKIIKTCKKVCKETKKK